MARLTARSVAVRLAVVRWNRFSASACRSAAICSQDCPVGPATRRTAGCAGAGAGAGLGLAGRGHWPKSVATELSTSQDPAPILMPSAWWIWARGSHSVLILPVFGSLKLDQASVWKPQVILRASNARFIG